MLRRGSKTVLFSSTVLAGLMTLTSPAHAVVRWTPFFDGEIKGNTWYSTTVPIQARYNGIKSVVWNGATPQVAAYVWVGGNAFSGPGKVQALFEYQGGTFKCKWRGAYGESSKAPLECMLRYGN